MIKHLQFTGAGLEFQIFPVQFSGQKRRWPSFKMATTQGNKRQKEREQEGRMGRKHKPSILWALKPHYVPYFWEHSSKRESWI